MIFSHNETLQLQGQVAELENRLAQLQGQVIELEDRLVQYEPVERNIRVFESLSEYSAVADRAWEYCEFWIVGNVHGDGSHFAGGNRYDHEGMQTLFDVYEFANTIKHCLCMVTGLEKWSSKKSNDALTLLKTALHTMYVMDKDSVNHTHMVQRASIACLRDWFEEISFDRVEIKRDENGFLVEGE
tara:strand:+ start:998 stop:1555 length:558 start_codon:yes stop_codon:yes gene_type:complete